MIWLIRIENLMYSLGVVPYFVGDRSLRLFPYFFLSFGRFITHFLLNRLRVFAKLIRALLRALGFIPEGVLLYQSIRICQGEVLTHNQLFEKWVINVIIISDDICLLHFEPLDICAE